MKKNIHHKDKHLNVQSLYHRPLTEIASATMRTQRYDIDVSVQTCVKNHAAPKQANVY